MTKYRKLYKTYTREFKQEAVQLPRRAAEVKTRDAIASCVYPVVHDADAYP